MRDVAQDTGWFTSSHSGSGNADCVEVRITKTLVRVRDSKDLDGPEIHFNPATWKGFLRQDITS